jgi:hypothetical protein
MPVMINWWQTGCHPMGGCMSASITIKEGAVWPVWRNPQDPNYFTIKIHDLKKDRWFKLQGHLCDKHMHELVSLWEVETEEDVQWMERTDNWAAKQGGNI